MSLSIIGFISSPPIENGKANWQFALFSRKVASKESNQTSWERRHPCLLASVSRPLPGTPQARMPALPGSCPTPAPQRDMWNSCGKSTRQGTEDCDPLSSILSLRSSLFVTGGLVDLLLSDVEF